MATALYDHVVPVPFPENRFNLETKSRHLFFDPNHGVKSTPQQLIGDALRQRVENIDHEFCEPGDEDTFFVADLGEVYRQHMRWKLNLPRVRPFYGE